MKVFVELRDKTVLYVPFREHSKVNTWQRLVCLCSSSLRTGNGMVSATIRVQGSATTQLFIALQVTAPQLATFCLWLRDQTDMNLV
jgi:hypothetical protein